LFTLVAVIVYTPADPGAVYVTGDPLAVVCNEKVPQAAPLQTAPEALQYTPPPSLAVAVNEKLCVTANPVFFGLIVTAATPGLIVIDSDPLVAVSAGVLESFTLKIKPVTFPAVVGVPLIPPEEDKPRRVGRLPLMRDQL
jgi:hypothetical protein